MFCRKCGQQLPDSALFCGKCGTKVMLIDQVSTNPVDTENPSPAVAAENNAAPMPPANSVYRNTYLNDIMIEKIAEYRGCAKHNSMILIGVLRLLLSFIMFGIVDRLTAVTFGVGVLFDPEDLEFGLAFLLAAFLLTIFFFVTGILCFVKAGKMSDSKISIYRDSIDISGFAPSIFTRAKKLDKKISLDCVINVDFTKYKLKINTEERKYTILMSCRADAEQASDIINRLVQAY